MEEKTLETTNNKNQVKFTRSSSTKQKEFSYTCRKCHKVFTFQEFAEVSHSLYGVKVSNKVCPYCHSTNWTKLFLDEKDIRERNTTSNRIKCNIADKSSSDAYRQLLLKKIGVGS